MRTLKRTLCLVLALVMVLGLFGIASATSFPDDEKIQYKEAVDVMTGIDSINGMGDGTFAPAGKVTRAQAAKMVAYAILGADIAKNLPVTASSFQDVDSNYNWAIPSIEYLADKGVVGGRSGRGGNFDPEGEVTAYEIAKMLLCAAGYGKNGEFTGNSWALNVAITAQRNGVFTGSLAADLNAAATREECALYCFNVLTKVDMVNYDESQKAYVLKGAKGDNLGKEVYGLEKAATETNDEGYTGYCWNATKISDKPITELQVTDKVLKTYGAGAKLDDIKTELKIAADATIEEYANGVKATSVTLTAVPVGSTLKVVKSGDIYKLLVTTEKLAKIGAYDETADKTTVTIVGGADVQVTGKLNFAKDTFVIVVPRVDAETTFLSMTEAKTVSGTVTAKGSDYFRLDGEKMNINGNNGLVLTDLAIGENYILVVDSFGNAIAKTNAETPAEAPLNYVYVSSFQAAAGVDAKEDLISSTPAKAAEAKMSIVNLDGTTAVVDYAINAKTESDGTVTYSYTLPGAADAKEVADADTVAAGFYSYTKDANGAYTLKALEAEKAAAAATSVVVKKDSAAVTVDAETKYATSATVLSVYAEKKLSTVTGIANFPEGGKTYTADADTKVLVIFKDNIVNGIYVLDSAEAAPIITPATYAAYLGEGETDVNGTAYRFFVNGEVVEYYKTASATGTLPAANGVCTIELTDGKISNIGTVPFEVADAKAISFIDATYFMTADGVVYFNDKTIVYDLTGAAPVMGKLAKDANVQYVVAGGVATFALISK